jgi:hypothetical protein
VPIINVTIRDKIAKAVDLTEYICGNSDFVVNFDFDDEWNEYDTKTARFVHGGTHTDVIFEGNQCAVPIISNTYNIKVGVFAGNLHTTTPAYISAKKSILCGSGIPAAPADDVYNQLMELLQNIIDRVEALENGGAVDVDTAELGAAILGRLKLR